MCDDAHTTLGVEPREGDVAMLGRKDDGKQQQVAQWRQVLQAEFERLNGLSLADLATEVFTKGFGPGTKGADDDSITVGQQNINAGPTAAGIASAMVPDEGQPTFPNEDDQKLIQRVARLVAEGLQALEHASLVRAQMHTSMGGLDFAATRRGRAALEQGNVKELVAGQGS